MSGTYRHGRVYCQVGDCRRRAHRAVGIEIPTDWEATPRFRVVAVTLGACVEHGRQLERLASELLSARAEHHDLVCVIDGGTLELAQARAEVVALGQAELEEAGAAAFERQRADQAELELHVLERAYMRLLEASGSDAADVREMRIALGLPA